MIGRTMELLDFFKGTHHPLVFFAKARLTIKDFWILAGYWKQAQEVKLG
jgi:hypothetical protein